MRVFNRHVSQRHLTVFLVRRWSSLARSPSSRIATAPATRCRPRSVRGALVDRALPVVPVLQRSATTSPSCATSREVFIRLLQAVGTALILIALLYLALPWLVVADGAFLPAAAIFLVGNDGLAAGLQSGRRRSHAFGERILIVGTDATAQAVARQVLAQEDFPYEIVGFIDQDPRPGRRGGGQSANGRDT